MKNEPVAMADVLGDIPIPANTRCEFGGVCQAEASERISVDFAGTRYVGFGCPSHVEPARVALLADLKVRLSDGTLP